MSRTLLDTTALLLDDLPPFMANSKDIQAVVDVCNREVERIEAARDHLINNFFPQTGDDWLEIYESLLGLSINPPDKTIAQRRTSILAFMQKIRGDGTGLDWQDNMTALIGTGWTYLEAIPSALLPTNLITNPSFESNTTDWTNSGAYMAGGATLTRDTTQFQTGAASLKVVATGANQGAIWNATGTFKAGQTYTFSAYVRGNAGGEPVYMNVGNAGGDHASGTFTTLTTGWQRISLSWTPATDQTSVFGNIITNGAATFFIDAVMLNKGGLVTYFDGSTSGYGWTGTANNSTSQLVDTVPAWTVRVLLPFSTALGAPVGLTATPGTGGSPGLAANTYHYKVTATNFYGETIASADATATVVASGKATLNWTAKTGASGYKVYRGTTSSNHVLIATITTATNTYVDQGGQPASSQAPPNQDTTESFQAGEAKALARAITPAHLALDFGLQAGFLVGISALGDVM